MEKYLFLTLKDKKALIKLAEAKQLSVSTTAGIIINNLAPLVENMYTDYIEKGDKMIHIKIKKTNKAYNYDNLTSLICTNCLYCYFNRPLYKGKKVNFQHKYIQSELDTTEDPNKDKSKAIKIAYLVNKLQKKGTI